MRVQKLDNIHLSFGTNKQTALLITANLVMKRYFWFNAFRHVKLWFIVIIKLFTFKQPEIIQLLAYLTP